MMHPWDVFSRDKLTKIFSEKKRVIDIGGGLRISKEKGNRHNSRNAWLTELARKVDYKILDPVADYHPDIIGDIHNLPFADSSEESIVCIAVLEHVQNPIKAAQELSRVLVPGGYCFVYVPFLYYYHAMPGYYQDYWRFTEDAIRYMFKDFSKIEIVSVRGAIETLLYLSPLGRVKLLCKMAYLLDILTGKIRSKQVSGYNVFLTK